LLNNSGLKPFELTLGAMTIMREEAIIGLDDLVVQGAVYCAAAHNWSPVVTKVLLDGRLKLLNYGYREFVLDMEKSLINTILVASNKF